MQVLKRKPPEHPCFNAGAGKYGRIHLPVAPLCNIQCAYCDRRFDCANESRPGVASAVISPMEALRRVREAVTAEPRIRVAGIAGPGDPLASRETFETLYILRREFPRLILCLSTNGLLLEDTFDHLAAARLDTLTITINAVTPETASKIYTAIQLGDIELAAKAGARILLERQRRAIKLCVRAGIAVKVNTVLIPGVNEDEIAGIARLAADSGASLMNITPLIPRGRMSDIPAPTTGQLTAARDRARKWIRQFTHCKQCRADACGMI